MYKMIIFMCMIHGCFGINYLRPIGVESASDSVKNGKRVNSTLYRTVKKYYCAASDLEDSYLILYGSKGWTFPIQDVNITLSYPTTYMRKSESWDDFLIIGFRVNLHLDGPDTTGYISGGGIYKDSIELTFICNKISTLRYQFWLYGIPKSLNPAENNNYNFLIC